MMLILGLLYFLIDDISCSDCGLFVAAYTECLSDGLQVPSCEIISQSLRMIYSGYVSNNEDPQSLDLKNQKFICPDENAMIQKRHGTKTGRKKKNKNFSSTLLEELASEAVSSSQVEPGVSQEHLEILHEDDVNKTVNAHNFLVHFQPNATGDSLIRSTMKKSFDSFRTGRIVWAIFLGIVILVNILIFQ
ncbi:hypothetical protein H5410_056995 [Solanum commersonii]|uniref:Uncharacterized protein n=1 Tax=Solanum commersonii TaxID=4109 RepID=A0A9J5WND8_SOLCO|nr:hypothetical protein H5410_056995 [Solanum commersonii]